VTAGIGHARIPSARSIGRGQHGGRRGVRLSHALLVRGSATHCSRDNSPLHRHSVPPCRAPGQHRVVPEESRPGPAFRQRATPELLARPPKVPVGSDDLRTAQGRAQESSAAGCCSTSTAATTVFGEVTNGSRRADGRRATAMRSTLYACRVDICLSGWLAVWLSVYLSIYRSISRGGLLD